MKKLALFCLWPVAILLFLSTAQGWLWPGLLPREFSLRAWNFVVEQSGGPLFTSLSLAVTVAILSTLISLPAARVLALHSFTSKRLLLWLLFLPLLTPPLASAMGLHGLFLRYGLTDQWIGVMLVHLIPSVPYAALTLMASFSKLDIDLEAQAKTLGASKWQVWRHVTGPSIAPGIALALTLSFLMSWSQYLLTLLIGGGRILTLPIVLVGFEKSGDGAVAAAMALLLMLPPTLFFVIGNSFLRETQSIE